MSEQSAGYTATRTTYARPRGVRATKIAPRRTAGGRHPDGGCVTTHAPQYRRRPVRTRHPDRAGDGKPLEDPVRPEELLARSPWRLRRPDQDRIVNVIARVHEPTDGARSTSHDTAARPPVLGDPDPPVPPLRGRAARLPRPTAHREAPAIAAPASHARGEGRAGSAVGHAEGEHRVRERRAPSRIRGFHRESVEGREDVVCVRRAGSSLGERDEGRAGRRPTAATTPAEESARHTSSDSRTQSLAADSDHDVHRRDDRGDGLELGRRAAMSARRKGYSGETDEARSPSATTCAASTAVRAGRWLPKRIRCAVRNASRCCRGHCVPPSPMRSRSSSRNGLPMVAEPGHVPANAFVRRTSARKPRPARPPLRIPPVSAGADRSASRCPSVSCR